jgi:hypothetical protein
LIGLLALPIVVLNNPKPFVVVFLLSVYGADAPLVMVKPNTTDWFIIGFEIFINWNKPIILVEGPFDAMTVKRNVIPLFGKVILPELEKKIIKSNVNKIYIALDEDAHKESLKHCEHFMNNGKEIYLVDIKDKDFNELGFEESLKVLHNSYPLTFKDLITQKMNLW